ncbi:MAG TPA: hypothetical protein VLA49_03810, partial [Anaerolineales bacterium]|nr:hypothetical protein [Anaerolineales bacterium]
MKRNKKSRFWFLLVLLSLLVALPGASLADHPYQTPEGAFITLAVPGEVTPIISSGEDYHGFIFEGIPDGIGIAPGPEAGTVDVYVTHEQSRVPFRNQADFQDSSISKLTLNSDAEVIAASVALGPEQGYIRFCSAFMAGPDEGFSRYTFFTGEESNDIIAVPAGAQYGPDPALAPDRQAGYAVVLDTETGAFTEVAGMGRHNHENTIV